MKTTKKLATQRTAALQKYDPHKGAKAIATATMIQKHYTKARDAEKLEQAVRWKWDAQAEFVLWWDTQAMKDPGTRYMAGGRKKTTAAVFDKLEDFGLDKFVVHEWRKVCSGPDKFKAAVEADFQHALARIERERREHRVSQNSGENEWYTPAELIEAARDVLGGIDLDPATTEAANKIVKAAQIFTAADSGLDQPWHGRIWMNPPYAQPLVSRFAEKYADEVRAGHITAGIVLINNATETEFFRAIVDVSSALCCPQGRVRFWSPEKESATPLQGQCLLYAGPFADVFCLRFSAFGHVWQRWTS